MAARGYEFYLWVLKVSLTSERSEQVRDTFSTRFVSPRGRVISSIYMAHFHLHILFCYMLYYLVHVILFSCYWILTSCAKILFHSQTELKPQETILVTVSKHLLPALSSIAKKRACFCRARPTDILVKISPNLCFDLVVHFQSTMKK